MSSVRATLLGVFARHSCTEIENATRILVDAFGEPSYDAVKALIDFDKEYAYASNAKQPIERIAARFPDDAGQQALLCLNSLKELRAKTIFKNEQYEVARELTLKTLFQTWPQSDQRLFFERLAVIDSWSDFFMSYTTRDALATNNYHEDLIVHEFGWPKEEERQRKNYVARVLAKYLEKENIHGFVDYKSLQCGDDIKEQIIGHCQTTIAFIQVVEAATLAEPQPPIRNWCLEEYEAFAKASAPVSGSAAVGNRLFFVVAANKALPQPAAMGASYQNWRAQMEKDLHILVANHSKPFEDLRSEVGGIARQIASARTRIIESMLESWP